MSSSTCPVCGGSFSLSDRLAHPPVCRVCEKAGVKAPRAIVRPGEARTELLVGRIVIILAVAFAGYVALRPVGNAGSLAGKLTLLGFAVLATLVGLVQAAAAKRRLRHSRD